MIFEFIWKNQIQIYLKNNLWNGLNRERTGESIDTHCGCLLLDRHLRGWVYDGAA